jgi:hypothetical protein
MTFVEMLARRPAVEINRTEYCVRNYERDTKQGMNTQFRQRLHLTESFVAGDVAYDHADSIAPHALHHSAAYANRMAGAANTIPCNGGTELVCAIKEQYSSSLGRNQIEDHAQELPLQRILVPNTPDAGGNFEQRVQIAGHAGGLGEGRNPAIRSAVLSVFWSKQKCRVPDLCGFRQLNRVSFEMKFVFPEQEYEHGTADGDLVSVGQKLFVDGYAIDARSVSTSQIADCELLVLWD